MASAVASSSAGPETRSERRVSGSGKGGGSPVSTSDVALTIPAFACMVEARVSFVFANRTTHSDVMSVKTTSAPVLVPPPVRRAGAQANQVRRLVLPTPKTLPVHPAFSTAKKSKALIRERDAFMARLRQEREERHLRENLAAVRIQAVWRGQQVRPKPKRVTRQRKQRPTLKDWREELRALTNATEEHLGGGDGEPKPEWRRNIQRKATAKRTRKLQRAVQYTAAASMQALARGFLARRAFRVVLGLHRQEVEHDAVTYIQAMFRGFALRRSMAEAGRLKREDAAISIQRVVRGTQARTRCRWLMRRMRAAQEETAAATSIQCAFRASAARRAVDGKRQHKAAVRVQSSMRGHRARRDVTARTTQRREAAVHIQRTGRGYLARQEYGPRVEEAKERAKQERAATRIQSIARGRQARRRVAAKRVEVAEERAARAAQEEKAALHMQRVGRGKLARKRVQGIRDERKQHAAATKIQAVKRGKSARLHVRKKRRVRGGGVFASCPPVPMPRPPDETLTVTRAHAYAHCSQSKRSKRPSRCRAPQGGAWRGDACRRSSASNARNARRRRQPR